MRPYTLGGPNAHISRDPLTGEYLWAVLNSTDGSNDELQYPFLADGTDVAPLYPDRFNVGSLDHLVEMSLRGGVAHRIMAHMTIGGSPQDQLWHLDSHAIQLSADGFLADIGNDLLVTDEGVYGCGFAGTHHLPDSSAARVVKLDLQGNMLWNILWRDPAHAVESFGSVAVIGDSVYCSAAGQQAVFDRITGDFLGTVDITGQDLSHPVLLARGNLLYWCATVGDDILLGWRDMATGQSLAGSTTLAGQYGWRGMVVDDQDRVWIATNTVGTGHWLRFDTNLVLMNSGTLYQSIEDMCFVNGSISFTGILDSASSTAYVITGTPQP